MNEPKHSPEPWSADDQLVRDSGRNVLKRICFQKSYEEDCANAERIVACVNFCAGIPTDDSLPPWPPLKYLLEESQRVHDQEVKDSDTIADPRSKLESTKKAQEWVEKNFLVLQIALDRCELIASFRVLRELRELIKLSVGKEKECTYRTMEPPKE